MHVSFDINSLKREKSKKILISFQAGDALKKTRKSFHLFQRENVLCPKKKVVKKKKKKAYSE